MQVIKKIGVSSAARIYGLTIAAIGAIIGIPYGLIALAFIGADNTGLPFGSGFFLLIIIGIPIFYGIIGFLIGALFAWVYNLVASKVGGLEIELSDPITIPTD